MSVSSISVTYLHSLNRSGCFGFNHLKLEASVLLPHNPRYVFPKSLSAFPPEGTWKSCNVSAFKSFTGAQSVSVAEGMGSLKHRASVRDTHPARICAIVEHPVAAGILSPSSACKTSCSTIDHQPGHSRHMNQQPWSTMTYWPPLVTMLISLDGVIISLLIHIISH